MYVENFKVSNRQAFSVCNIKDNIRTMDEIEIQNCTLTRSCYDMFDDYNKHEYCKQNIDWAVPPEINQEPAYTLAQDLQWIAYCDYAWPGAITSTKEDNYGILTGNWPEICPHIDSAFPLLGWEIGRMMGFIELEDFSNIGRKNEDEYNATDMNDCRSYILTLNSNNKFPSAVEWNNITDKCYYYYDSEKWDQTIDKKFNTSYTSKIIYGGIPDIKTNPQLYSVPECKLYPTDEFYVNCFDKTTPYTQSCSNVCMEKLREEVNRTDCKKIENLKSIPRLVGNECLQDGCQQQINDFTSKQFCAYQRFYHTITTYEIETIHTVNIPPLDKSSCTEQCKQHLSQALNYYDWEEWCLEYASGNIWGFCSTTDCNCDSGYDGQQCELECPMGSADGEDAICSGTNGFCVPKDTSDIFADTSEQRSEGEYYVGSVTNVPLWLTGPDPLEGVCECIVGSGAACELSCDSNNNGTYGINHNCQFGICDTYVAKSKSLPPCTRYNSNGLNERGKAVSYNSTTYDNAIILNDGLLLFCETDDMLDGALIAAYEDSAELNLNEVYYNNYSILCTEEKCGTTDDEENVETISFPSHLKHATVIWNKICFPWPADSIYTFKHIPDVNKKFVQSPKYIPDKWKHVETNTKYNDETPDYEKISIDVEALWYNSIEHTWANDSHVNLRFEDDKLEDMSTVDTEIECGKLAMKNYDISKGMFQIQRIEGTEVTYTCYLVKSNKYVSHEDFVSQDILPFNDEVTRPEAPSVIHAGHTWKLYHVDLDNVIESKRKLDINKKTPNPTEYNVSIPTSGTSGYEYNIFGRWGVMVNENLTLHVERNKKTYEHVLVTAYKNSTDEEAHVITLGNLPDNTRYPGLVNIGNNQILMFGGFYVWNNEEDESYGVSDEMFLITVEEITWYDGVNDIPIVPYHHMNLFLNIRHSSTIRQSPDILYHNQGP